MQALNAHIRESILGSTKSGREALAVPDIITKSLEVMVKMCSKAIDSADEFNVTNGTMYRLHLDAVFVQAYFEKIAIDIEKSIPSKLSKYAAFPILKYSDSVSSQMIVQAGGNDEQSEFLVFRTTSRDEIVMMFTCDTAPYKELLKKLKVK